MKKVNNILKLLTWNNQSFPIGSYSFSSGLEYAIESNIINSALELQDWLKGLINFGSLKTDAMLLSEAWGLNKKKKYNSILKLNDFAVSLNQSYEKYIENHEQGKAFIKITSDTWNHYFVCKQLLYPIAFACSAVQEDISLEDTIICFLHASLCNLLSAGIKLIPLGQTDGQKIQIEINKEIEKQYKVILKEELKDIGSCGWVNDIISMKHENQFTRLFRT